MFSEHVMKGVMSYGYGYWFVIFNAENVSALISISGKSTDGIQCLCAGMWHGKNNTLLKNCYRQ